MQVQFGHAGACASGEMQTADWKNRALRKAGAVVPDSFQGFGEAIRTAYKRLVAAGTIVPREERAPPAIPVVRERPTRLPQV